MSVFVVRLVVVIFQRAKAVEGGVRFLRDIRAQNSTLASSNYCTSQ